MGEIVLNLSAREHREIEAIARLEGEKIGRVDPVSVDEMALALLQSHLVLIRDCGDILPGTGPKLKQRSAMPAGKKITGLGGVSLSGGVNAGY